MSNAGQAVGAVVGGVIGFVASGFNPVGAYWGFNIGLMAGTLIFPTQLPKQFGPRLKDIEQTTAQLGSPIGITYGTFAVPGQIIALGCVEEVERVDKVGGKGGPPEQKVVSYSYFQTVAVGLCEGVICGVQRIWENGELKYDTRDQLPDEDLETYSARIESSGQFATTFTLYIGDETQLPDPDLEAIYGEGMVHAFRGLAYIVFPDRALREDQALRHPQWRFEVVRGPGERGVTSPTLIDGPLDGFTTDRIAVDWVHNRYFTMDESGGSLENEAEGIRAFTLRDNTEFLQRTYADIGMVQNIASYQPTVGVDGFLYLCHGITNDDGIIYKINPQTLDVEAQISMGLFDNQWDNAITTRAVLSGFTADFLLAVSLLGNVITVRSCDSLTLMGQLDDGREEARLVQGPGLGDAISIVYCLCYDEAQFGTSDPVELRYIECGVVIGLSGPVPAVDFETRGTIPNSAFKSDWVRIAEIEGVVYDLEDGGIIFSVAGSASTGLGGIERRIVKINPETLEFIWNVEDALGFRPIFDDNHNLSRIANGEYVLASASAGSLLRLDTATGEVITDDWTDLIPGNQTFTGEEIWDGVTGCLITFVQDIGPVLICDNVCGTEGITIGEIVEDICLRTGVPIDGYDVSELTKVVHGYGIMRNMSGRDAIEVLRPVGSFDSVESGMVIKFPVRGRGSTKTYLTEELGAHIGLDQGPPAVTVDKVQSVELPRLVRAHYIAHTRDYEPGEKLSPTRFSPEVENELDIEVPVALDDDQAAQVADVVQADLWAGRWKHSINVDMSQLAREPTDVVLVPIDNRLYRCRIVDIQDTIGGLLRVMTLVRDDDGSYVSTAISDPPQVSVITGPVIISVSSLIILDLPPLREQDDNAGMYAVVYRTTPTRSWGGAVVARSTDGGTTWSQLTASTVEGTVGVLESVLGVGDHTMWDTRNYLDVTVLAGEFESRDQTALFNGANAVAVGDHGRWEIVQFLSAEMIDMNTARLSGLLRGRRGTEVFIGTSEVGDHVVLLSDGSLMRAEQQTSQINQEYGYRATTIGLQVDLSSSQDFTGEGRALEPWAPTGIEGVRDISGDLSITFHRRSRLGSDLLPSGFGLPLTDTPEAYEIDIIGDSDDDVLRTIDTSVESATYTAAEQTTDFGSPQASVTVKIYQMSTIVGRGLAGEATI